MRYFILFIAFSLITLSACKKDETSINFSLPPVTQSGRNTLGFDLNSEVWTLYGQSCLFLYGCTENPHVTFFSGDLNMSADRVLSKNNVVVVSQSISFESYNYIRSSGFYAIRKIDKSDTLCNFSYQDKIAQKVYGSITERATMTLHLSKFDTLNKIISGEFSGTLFSYGSGCVCELDETDSILITNGRFDFTIK